MKRETLTARINAIQNRTAAEVDNSRPNARVVAINRAEQVQQESDFTGLSNWTRLNVNRSSK